MIIIKTEQGDIFVNEKETISVTHNRDDHTAYINEGGNVGMSLRKPPIENVESVSYINEQTGNEWKDEGSEIQRLKNTIEKKKKEYDQLYEHFGYMRDWFLIYYDALNEIKDRTKEGRENKGLHVSPITIIERAETRYHESLKRYERERQEK